jgi:glutaredoxin
MNRLRGLVARAARAAATATSRAPRRTLAITLYGKSGCHLCDDADALLSQYRERFNLAVRHVDISTDVLLFREYDVRIPVIVADDGSELSAPIRRRDLERMLEAASRRAERAGS